MKSARPVLLAVALSVIFLVVYRRFVPSRSAKPQGAKGPYELQIHSIPVTHKLALGNFEVPAMGTHDVKITLDEPRMQNARLTGRFETKSGSGIQVMLLDETDYGRFTNHSTHSQYFYLSNSATSGNIEAKLPHTGTYYLVFDNSSSPSGVRVNADVTTRYETVQVDSQHKLR